MNSQKCGVFIADLRKEKNLTQKDLANELKVSDKAISRWETGKGFPDVDSLQSLSKFFGITINELLAGEKAETKTIEEIAEENIISAIVETEKSKKTKKSTVILSIIYALIILIPLLKNSVDGVTELLNKYTLVENPSIVILLLFMSLCFFFMGFVVYKGHYKILHKYHYRNVTDYKGFCHELGKELMTLSAPIFISAILELWVSIEVIATISESIISISFLVYFIFLFKTLLKYNGSIF